MVWRDTVVALMFGGRDPGWRKRLWAVAAAFVVMALAGPASAQTEGDGPALGWSVGTGCVLMLGAMAAGGGLAASSSQERIRKTGLEIFAGGMVLAPVASHAIAREWKRAAVFGAITLSLAATATVLLEGADQILDFGRSATRVPFGAALAVELVVSGAGLSDSLMAGERARERRRLALLPLLSHNTAGLSLRGWL
jgi:peptidoglycan/LPS O-acetylase OafA/YrhL